MIRKSARGSTIPRHVLTGRRRRSLYCAQQASRVHASQAGLQVQDKFGSVGVKVLGRKDSTAAKAWRAAWHARCAGSTSARTFFHSSSLSWRSIVYGTGCRRRRLIRMRRRHGHSRAGVHPVVESGEACVSRCLPFQLATRSPCLCVRACVRVRVRVRACVCVCSSNNLLREEGRNRAAYELALS